MGYTIRKLTSGFLVEEGADVNMGTESRKHGFTTLKEALEFIEDGFFADDPGEHK